MTELLQQEALSGDDASNNDARTEIGEISPLLTSSTIIAALVENVHGEIEKLAAGRATAAAE
jgi:hypothetical protein